MLYEVITAWLATTAQCPSHPRFEAGNRWVVPEGTVGCRGPIRVSREKGMAETLPREQILSRFLDSITDPLVIYDRDYRIVTVNQSLATTYQVDVEHIIGRYCYEVFHGRGSVCEACHIGDVFRTGEPQRREKVVPLPDGRLRHCEIRAYPVKDSEGTVIQAIEHGRDISERKGLEGRFKASEERYQTILEIAREGIFIADGESRVTFANNRMAGMLGYRIDEILGRSLLDLMDESSKTVVKELLGRRRKGSSDVYELSFRSRDGTYLRNNFV